jgi:apolipoprotein N-acyltransferase
MSASEQSPARCTSWLVAAAPLVAGLGAGLAYADDRLAWLAWFALVPLGLVWSRSKRTAIPLSTAFLGGLLYHALALSWLRTCYADAGQWFGPRAAGWLVMSVVCAAFFAAMCRYGHYLVRVVRLPATLALPLAWVSMEFAKQYAGLAFSQAEYPWARLGLTQAAWLTMAQSADLGGEPLLSLLVCVANGALADAFASVRPGAVLARRRLVCGAVCGAVLLAAAGAYGQWRLDQSAGRPGPVVCLMGELDLPPFLDKNRVAGKTPAEQPPQLLLWSELAWHHKLVDAPSADGAWPADTPEDVTMVAHGDMPTYNQFVRRSLLDSARDVNAVLVLGCERLEKTGGQWRRFNSVICVDPAADSIGCYDKERLVPFGEYVPYTPAGSQDVDTTYSEGSPPPVFAVPCGSQTFRFRASICYDLCFAAHFRPDARQGGQTQVDFFVHCGSEGQDPSGALARVLLKAAQLRAIESRRAIVRNVDHGYSGIVDSSGMVHNVTALDAVHQPTLLSPVAIDCRMSLYTAWGDRPLLVLCAATGLLAWWRRPR